MSRLTTRVFDPKDFLAQTGLGRTIMQYPKDKVIFAQGEPSDAVFYIQDGRAKLTVLSPQGKEATITLLGDGDFIGEGCITSDQPLRVASATAVTQCSVLRIEKKASAPPSERIFRLVCGIRRGTLQPDSGRPGGSAVQLCREAAGPDSFAVGPLWQRRQIREYNS